MRWTAAILLTTSVAAENSAAQTKPAANPCAKAEYRQFDFWLGRWDVMVDGGQAGTNEVTLEEDGCVLHERWAGARGQTGQSLNFYDRSTRKWRQVWIDSGGNSLDLWGGPVDGRMILVGKVSTPRGTTLQRIAWSRNPDGTIRQLWESSSDEGKTWSTSFDGLLRKR